MSQQYQDGDYIPTQVLAKRLDELSDAVTKGAAGMNEFYMRIPAERDRDADLVLAEAAKRLRELTQIIDRIQLAEILNGAAEVANKLDNGIVK